MDISALEPILDLRVATRRALAEWPADEHAGPPKPVEGAREARERARAALEKADDDPEGLIAAIVSASQAPLPPPDAPAPKRTNARSASARRRKKT